MHSRFLAAPTPWDVSIAQELGRDISELPYNVLTSDKLREEFGQATFFTATDGNHGRGVAWPQTVLVKRLSYICLRVPPKTRFDNIAKKAHWSRSRK